MAIACTGSAEELKYRIRAFLIHFGISFVIFLGLAFILLYIWFPDFFYASDGGWEGMRIVVGVDLVMGPLLTFTVYRPGKRGLKFDLTMIGLAQAACLAAGLYIIHAERPLALVFADGRFYTMSADDYTELGLEPPDLSYLPGSAPKRVVVPIPTDVEQQSEFRGRLWNAQIPVRAAVESYEPLEEYIELAIDGGVDPALLRERDLKGEIPRWLEAQGGELTDYAFVPFATRFNNFFLAIRLSDRKVIGLLDVPAPLH
jgi:hypothetical protein